jgi:UrcA family protein
MLRFIILAATASVAFVSPSFADPDPQETPYEVVYFGDLNLKYDADADQMMRRIDRASNNVCNDRVGNSGLQERINVANCAQVAERRAVIDVNHPNIDRRHYGAPPRVIIEPEDTDYSNGK